MRKKECIAMLLAGGQGSRLGALTSNIAKPAVSFAGKYRIIDFSLSNCVNSGIDTVGVLIQYRPLVLNKYIGTGEAWNLDSADGGVHVLPPYATQLGGEWYQGTADSIYHNIDFIDSFDPEYVLILSADHLYKMDYNKMLQAHKDNKADLTISVMEVPWEEASRFGIMSANDKGRITKFAEKPKKPESNLASMGIYIFNWSVLRKALIEDRANEKSDHDFGKNVIPKLLGEKKKLFAYKFEGYWQDVGTIQCYYDTQMELLSDNPGFDIFDRKEPIYSNNNFDPPHKLGKKAEVSNSIVCNGGIINGKVKHSIIGTDSIVGDNCKIEDSIILPNAVIESGCSLKCCIVNEGVTVKKGSVCEGKDGDILVIGADSEFAVCGK